MVSDMSQKLFHFDEIKSVLKIGSASLKEISEIFVFVESVFLDQPACIFHISYLNRMGRLYERNWTKWVFSQIH